MSSASLAEIDGMVQEVLMPSARGGRKPGVEVVVEVDRVLTPADLPALLSPERVNSPQQTVLQIRQTHHLLARCLAEGHSQEKAALITGYTPAYISTLKNDPAFAELLHYYGAQKEQVFVDVVERMRVLGLHTLEELQARLEAEPEKWTKNELMAMAEMLLGKGGIPAHRAGASPGAGGNALNINVKFIGGGAEAATVIEMEPASGK